MYIFTRGILRALFEVKVLLVTITTEGQNLLEC